jgi:ATP diphosphatase
MAEESGHFAFSDVATAIANKMEQRHPHIFGEAGSNAAVEPTGSERRWETIKATERAKAGATSALDGVALALPALMRAEKLQKRGARVGFDWPDPTGPAAKVLEELAELANAQSEAERIEEAGDLLFAAVNLVRANGVAPEDALRAANAKFERRFRAMEALNPAFARLSLDQQEVLWQRVKASEPGVSPKIAQA